ncbi:MAG: DUF3109 family protein [Prevotella sp.]|uniref:DUF3109 family protein n=1 Tax=Prevotella sp. TaxID=59823 RepID=UPI002A2B8156|nr:DUF3109 family protein [Prevotella sp.]MDD7318576.1 DUF3109 family protein [Prevotellaceae bacterium]MDY4020377.1 DUF3109 family protein [Prevotella sp.]
MVRQGVFDVSGVLVSGDVIFERFCCDLEKCKGQCCVEGDAGAPVTVDEVLDIEDALDIVFDELSEQAQSVILEQGVAYNDRDGDLVTSIVGSKDCVFTYYDDIELGGGVRAEGCCLCRLEKAFRDGRSKFCKPMSCALYPIREKTFKGGLVGLNYNRWNLCDCAREKGRELDIPVYRFLREPLIKRFGEEWYRELEALAEQLQNAQ